MPNTLAQLNSFSNQSYAFTDQRPYSISFSANATSNQSVSVAEDVSFTSPVGINITGVVSQPGNITYNINTGNIGNVILIWPTLPNTVSSSTPSTGVYRVTGIMDEILWDQFKNPTIVVKDRETNFSYTANIQYPNTANTALTNTWSWTNNVTISSSHSEMTNATAFTYDEDVPMTIPGTPSITDTYSGPLPHTLVITPNIATPVFSLSMSGNTSLNPVTKALTIVDTKATINSALGNLWLVPYPDTNLNYSINYSLTNPISNLNTQVNQAANIGNTQSDFTMTTAYNYAEGASTQLVFSVDDGDTTATSFTIAVNQTLGTSGIFFVNGVNAGIGNAASFTGTRTAFNSANITFMPSPDLADTINITANVYKINGIGNITVASNVVSTLTNTSSHNEYSLTTSYNFTEDTTVPMVFQITDTDVNATNYVSTFAQATGNTGAFYLNGTLQGVGNSVVMSNSKANINSANVSFLPAADATGNVGLTYTQVKTNTYFGNFTQANAVAITLVNNSSHNEYDLGGGYSESTLFNFGNIITDTDSRATTYTISLQQTSGNIGQWYLNGSLVGNANSVYSISNTRANINSSNIQWLPSWEDRGNVQFTYNQSKVNSVFGNITQASNVVVSKSCAANVTGLTNANVSRSYFSNVANTTIYSASTPTITDGSDVGQTYEIRLATAFQSGIPGYTVGGFGPNIANAITRAQGSISYYAITGNTTTVNAALANVVFAPSVGPDHNALDTPYAIALYRNGSLSTKVFVGNVVGANQAFANTINTFTSSSTWTPTVSETYYGGGIQILSIGGGGAGGTAGTLSGFPPTRSGGGGAGGNANIVTTAYTIANQSYSVVIGSGGKTAAAAGANSYVANGASNLAVATGGTGGNYGQQGIGGTSGPYAGGDRYASSPYHGGGGAGARAVGSPGLSGGPGSGGIGYNANAFLGGSAVYYGNGATGGSNSISGTNGVDGTGAGGGGAGYTGGSIGTGGNGIVIIKVVKA